MSESAKPAVVIIPGLRDHVDEHWQSYLAAELAADCQVLEVPTQTEDKLNLQRRLEAISNTLSQLNGPAVLVAHSAGCLMLVHWAAKQQCRQIQAALLVAPPDLNQPWPAQYPSPDTLQQQGWSPLPDQPLPFPALVVSSCNDHLATASAVAAMARQWHAALLPLGEVGHLNPASGFGYWPLARVLVTTLLQSPDQLCDVHAE